MNDIDSVAEEAVEHFGDTKQILKSIEELGELIEILAKEMSGLEVAPYAIDEIADVTIMVRQLRLIYGKEVVDQRIQYKLSKLMDRMSAK